MTTLSTIGAPAISAGYKILRFVLQSVVILPIVFIGSIICTFICGVIKFSPFNILPKARQIYIRQQIYKCFGEIELFGLEFWTNVRYVTSGDIISDDIKHLNTILIGNHCETPFDFVVLGSICDQLNRISNSFAFIKRQLLCYPILGWIEGVSPHGVVLNRNWESDQQLISALCDSFNERIDYALVSPWMWFLFPEGTRFSSSKFKAAQSFARQRGFPVYDHLLQPRVKGFSFLTHQLHPTLGCIIDVTIQYKHREPSGTDLVIGTRLCDYIHIHLRIYRQKDIPQEINELDQWLRDRWTEKDKILQNMKEGKISFTNHDRSPWRAIQYYTCFALLSVYLIINFFIGYPIWSVVTMIAWVCALLPVGIVMLERAQQTDFAKNA